MVRTKLGRAVLLAGCLCVLVQWFACGDGRSFEEDINAGISEEDLSPETQPSPIESTGIAGSLTTDAEVPLSQSVGIIADDAAQNIDAAMLVSARGDIYFCGDGIVDPEEECEPEDLAGRTCESLGEGHGVLSCDPKTCRFDRSRCHDAPICGDGLVEEGEQCELEDLLGQTCESLGEGHGALSCDPMTCRFDRSGCHDDPMCGDGIVEGDEECEPEDLAGRTCESLGEGQGVLSCNPETCRFDRTACNAFPPIYCGDDVVDTGEDCDGADLGGATCQTLGFFDGSLRCNTSCSFDVTQCVDKSTTCGNGIIEPPEECESINLAGMSCLALGYLGGLLSCNMATCTLDTSQCIKVTCIRGYCIIN